MRIMVEDCAQSILYMWMTLWRKGGRWEGRERKEVKVDVLKKRKVRKRNTKSMRQNK